MYKDLFKKAKAKGLKDLKIYLTSVEDLSLETLNDHLQKFNTSSVDTYEITAIYNDKKVQIKTENLDETVIDDLINASFLIEKGASASRTKLEDICETKKFTINNPKEVITSLLNLANLKNEYPSLKEINTIYSETIIKRTITTEDSKLSDINKETSFQTEVVVSENRQNSCSYNTFATVKDKEIDFTGLTKWAIENAIDKLHYQEIPDGTYDVILTSKVMGSILNSFISLFSADSIQKEISLLTGKLNQKVFSPKITIVEDPASSALIGKRLFDNSGLRTTYKEIVKDGVFITELHDEKTSTTKGVPNTANDYGDISVRNMTIKNGTKTLDELISSVDKGVLVDMVGGLHAGINQITGDISLQAEGYYIEDGVKKYATKLFVLSTSIMEILNNVEDLSNHTDIFLKTASAPDILLNNIKISK